MTTITAADLDAMPYRTIVVSHNGMTWKRITTTGPAIWRSAYGSRTSEHLLAAFGVAEVVGASKAVRA